MLARALRSVLSFLLVKAARAAMRLPDRALVGLARLARRGTAAVAGEGGALRAIREIEGLLRDPKGRRALRNLVLLGRQEQFRAFVRGTLRHHAGRGGAAAGPPATMPSERSPARAATPPRVGLVGEGDDLDLLRAAYSAPGSCSVVPIDPECDPLRLDGIDLFQAIEIADPRWARGEVVAALLAKKIALSLHQGCIGSAEHLAGLLGAAARERAPLRIFVPHLFYPPVRRAKALLDGGLLGEIATIRIRATIGGTGGSSPPALPDRERYLEHPAFDHFVLLAYLGGRLEKVAAYLHPIDPERGGQGIVSCKFAHPGRYGALECAFAPRLLVRSRHRPYDLEVEVAGSDGILWIRRGMAERVQGPAVEVRVGRDSFSFGVGTGLRQDWVETYAAAAADLLDMARGSGGRRVPDEGELLSAIGLRGLAAEAARSPSVLAL